MSGGEYVERLVRLETEAVATKEDIRDLRMELRHGLEKCEKQHEQVRIALELRERERTLELVRHDRDRKKDRQWLIGTIFAGSVVVVSAVGVLLSTISP